MNAAAARPPLVRHRIPAIDRTMDVLALLERRSGGASIRDLVAALKLPRTTVYRILNTLEFHDVVRRSGEGAYRLGPRLIALASRTLADADGYDLPGLSQRHLARLSDETGEGCKVSVSDGAGIVVVAAAQGTREYALTVVPGQRLPLHAGAAGKVILASLPKAEADDALAKALARYTAKTLADRKRLAAELGRIRRQGWAEDKGEYSPSIHAFAAPISDRGGRVVGALSVPFLAGATAAHKERVRASVIAVAAAISSDIPAGRAPSSPARDAAPSDRKPPARRAAGGRAAPRRRD